MDLLDGPPERQYLRNVALMVFSEHPDKFFPYTYIDLVQFPNGPADEQFIEKQSEFGTTRIGRLKNYWRIVCITGITRKENLLPYGLSRMLFFETDEGRTWFRVTLLIQPSFTQVSDNKQLVVSSEPIYKDFAKILLFLGDGSRKREDILRHIGLSNQTYSYRNYIEPLEKAGLVQKSFPDKPQSPRQQYLLTEKGESLILTFIGA